MTGPRRFCRSHTTQCPAFENRSNNLWCRPRPELRRLWICAGLKGRRIHRLLRGGPVRRHGVVQRRYLREKKTEAETGQTSFGKTPVSHRAANEKGRAEALPFVNQLVKARTEKW